MVDWKLAIDEERAALMRIVALLFSLADLAESASHRCRLVRSFVIWLLRPAESLAWDFVIGEQDAPPALMPIGPAGDGPADAMRLAESFRDLACELDYQARLAFAIQDEPGQGGLPRFGPCRALSADDFLNALRSVVATITCRIVRATGQPDTS